MPVHLNQAAPRVLFSVFSSTHPAERTDVTPKTRTRVLIALLPSMWACDSPWLVRTVVARKFPRKRKRDEGKEGSGKQPRFE